ncbi:MAG: hypothetical protein RL380_1104 [Verrucomicrobiota bacterium]|jgi:uncharacterized membrane protein (Fun14 family)
MNEGVPIPSPSSGRPPWRSKTLLLALGVAGGGIYFALKNPGAPWENSAGFRFGASFVGGFVIGWAFRQSLRLAAVAVAVLLMAVFVARWTGWFHLDWALLETSVRESLGWLRGEALGLKRLLTGWLPSGVAGLLGVWRGLRHR